jgi:hypothetical protein
MSIVRLLEECPHLHTLNLAGCENITNTELDYYRAVVVLHSSLTDMSIVRLAEGCPHLRTVSLYSCILITDACIVSLAQNCPGLQSFLYDYNG